MLYRRQFFGVISLFSTAFFLVKSAAAWEPESGGDSIIGLAAPTAPHGASGSPIYSPNGDPRLRSAGGIKFDDFIDDSKPNRLIRTNDGWYWGIPIKNSQTISGNFGVGPYNFSR